MSDQETNLPAVHVTSRADFIIGSLLFSVTLALQIVHVLEVHDTLVFDLNTMQGTDMCSYVTHARQIVDSGDLIGSRQFWLAPLQAYFIAFVMWYSGGGLLTACLVQALLGVLSTVLVYAAARQVCPPVFAAVAGALLGVYEASVFYTSFLLTTTLGVFGSSAILLLMMLACRYGSDISWLLLGLAVGITSLGRPSFMLFAVTVPAMILVMSRLGEPHVRRWGRSLALFLLAFCLIILPVTVRNAAVTGNFVPVSANGPATFRVANSYDSRVFNFVYPEKPLMPPWSATFWLHQAKKAAGFWIAYEVPQNVDIYLCRRYSSVLRLPLIPFVAIASAGLAGIILGRRCFRDLYPAYVHLITYYVSMVPFYVTSRFRLPMVPALALFAAFAARATVDSWNAGRKRMCACAVALAFALAVIIEIPLFTGAGRAMMDSMTARGLNNLATLATRREDLPAAIRLLGESLRIHRHQPAAYLRIGRMLAAEERPDEAIHHLETAIRMCPDDPEGYRLLGLVWLSLKGNQEKGNGYLDRFAEMTGTRRTRREIE